MKQPRNYWTLSRRALFKLVPPSVAGWLLPSPAPALAQPQRTPAYSSPAKGPSVKRWLAEWIWESLEAPNPLGNMEGPAFQRPPFRNLFACLRKTFEGPAGVSKAWAQVSANSRYKLFLNEP